MVPKQQDEQLEFPASFRAVLFRMVPKPLTDNQYAYIGFRAVLFRMVPKQQNAVFFIS